MDVIQYTSFRKFVTRSETHPHLLDERTGVIGSFRDEANSGSTMPLPAIVPRLI